jgi:hypothetical protein
MELARGIAGLLSWQWVVIILALSFHRPIGKLLNRVVGFRLGGEQGLQLALARELDQQSGQVIEPQIIEQTFPRVDAKLFVLRDDHGVERAKLGVTNTNSTSLTLYDQSGKERVSVFVLPDGSSAIGLYDQEKIRTMLARGEFAGVDGLSILGPDGRNGISLLVGSEGHPSFDITDQRGVPLFSSE